MMKYYKIDWIHDSNEEDPYCYYIEVGEDFYETRKIEKYKDGRVFYASEEIEKGTFLSPEPINDISIFNSKDDYETITGRGISQQDFLNQWNKLF